MHLTENPQVVTWPEMHYVFIEKDGPFQEAAPQTWTSLHAVIPAISEHNKIAGYMSLFKFGPNIYRAGVSLDDPAVNLPGGVEYTLFEGAKYSRFVLTGRFADLPNAVGRVLDLAAETNIAISDNFYIEHYLTDPRTTPDDANIIEILVPTV